VAVLHAVANRATVAIRTGIAHALLRVMIL
jgi:hypothetical protein